MTTIVYRDGVMAGDTATARGDTILPEVQRKVFRLRDGRLMAWCGNMSHMHAVRDLLNKEKKPKLPENDVGSGILVEPSGRVFTIECGMVTPVSGARFVAMGSGRDIAYGALAMGASAIEAVRIAAAYDMHTRLPIRWLKLKGR